MGIKIYKDGAEVADLPAVGRPIANQAEAEAGIDNTKMMTPLRTAQAIAALASGDVALATPADLGTSTVQNLGVNPAIDEITFNDSDGFFAGDSFSSIEAKIRATGGDCTNISVSGTSAPDNAGGAGPAGGVADADSNNEGAGSSPDNAFDGNTATSWISGELPSWIRYDRGDGNAINIIQYSVRGDATAWLFQGSNDGDAWTTIDSQSGQSVGDGEDYNVSDNELFFTQYRLNVTASSSEPLPGLFDTHIYEFSFTSSVSPPILDLDISFPAVLGNIAAKTATGTGATVTVTTEGIPPGSGTSGTVTGTDKLMLNNLSSPVSGTVTGTPTLFVPVVVGGEIVAYLGAYSPTSVTLS